ncbi:MAG: hypothetical protein IJP48_02005 [Synergistaceae bacterium]|nr:hypothetical protein [Synergistaceae bacterium]
MRKVFISLIIFLVMASESLAGFKVTLPSSWIRQDSGSTMVIKSLNTNASIAAAINSMGGADFTEIVERLYIQMQGTDLEQDEDGDYSFSFVDNSGAEGFVIITGEDDYYLVISVSGFQDDEKIKDDIANILDSLEYDD